MKLVFVYWMWARVLLHFTVSHKCDSDFSARREASAIERKYYYSIQFIKILKSFHNNTTQLNLIHAFIRLINDKRKRKIIKIENRCVQTEWKFRFQLNEKNYSDILNQMKCTNANAEEENEAGASKWGKQTKNKLHTHTHRGEMEKRKRKVSKL